MDLETLIEQYVSQPEALAACDRQAVEALYARDPEVRTLLSFLRSFHREYEEPEAEPSAGLQRFLASITTP